MRAAAHPLRTGYMPAHTTMTNSSLEVTILNKIARFRQTACHNQRGKCFYCRQPMWERDVSAFARKHGLRLKEARRFKATAEHLSARSEGGGDVMENIVAACWFCNSHRHRVKHPLCPKTFAQQVRRRLHQGRWHGFIAKPETAERSSLKVI